MTLAVLPNDYLSISYEGFKRYLCGDVPVLFVGHVSLRNHFCLVYTTKTAKGDRKDKADIFGRRNLYGCLLCCHLVESDGRCEKHYMLVLL
uniref:Uncharacterized protein n=1 Tax=Arundo donax TaxID=35708 RepID=A0A0A9DGF0_ARUDO